LNDKRKKQVCDNCGKIFERRPSERKQDRKFCNSICAGQFYKRERHYHWNGGQRIKSDGRLLINLPSHPRADPNGYIPNAVLVAEKALGKPLPFGAVVHHVKDIEDDQSTVICQNNGYHIFLHARKRIVDAGGSPNTQKICGKCHQLKNKDDFKHTDKYGGHYNTCKECERKSYRERRLYAN
jgi:hypothetical protein